MALSEELKGRLRSLLSKKFIVWAVATVAMFLKLIDGASWVWISGAYIGIEVGQKVLPGVVAKVKSMMGGTNAKEDASGFGQIGKEERIEAGDGKVQ